MVTCCAAALFGLIKLDAAAAGHAAEKARETLAKQAEAAESRTAVAPRDKPALLMEARDGEESIGERGPIPVPTGGAWGATFVRTPGAGGGLSRAVRPMPSTAPAEDPATGAAEGSDERSVLVAMLARRTPPLATPKAAEPAHANASLLALIAGCGIIMSLAGAALLFRTPR